MPEGWIVLWCILHKTHVLLVLFLLATCLLQSLSSVWLHSKRVTSVGNSSIMHASLMVLIWMRLGCIAFTMEDRGLLHSRLHVSWRQVNIEEVWLQVRVACLPECIGKVRFSFNGSSLPDGLPCYLSKRSCGHGLVLITRVAWNWIACNINRPLNPLLPSIWSNCHLTTIVSCRQRWC